MRMAISHGGHGQNSYALTWRTAVGPLAMLVQTAWGGVWSDRARDKADQARLWHRASRFVRAAERRGDPTQRRSHIRRVHVVVSPFRGWLEASIWDGVALAWDPVVLYDEDPWPQLGDLVASADPVR